mmetsp:Transcript_37390/g.112021  ORF Transcript_37390/g.112021 Transcript_37390/m.112021 type:complete len:581 (+) Transcript_37390:278-2020(+)
MVDDSSSSSRSRPSLRRFSSAPAIIRKKLGIIKSGSRSQDSDASGARRHKSVASRLAPFSKSPSGSAATEEQPTKPTFPHFNLLSDDIAVFILSFVSYAAFEEPGRRQDKGGDHRRLYNEFIDSISAVGRKSDRAAMRRRSGETTLRLDVSSFGTLTHVLPLVNHRFQNYCMSCGTLWSDATERMVLSSFEWREATRDWGRRNIDPSGIHDDMEKDADDCGWQKAFAGKVELNVMESNVWCSDSPIEKRRKASEYLVAAARSTFDSEVSDTSAGPLDNSSSLLRQNSESAARRFFVQVAKESQSFLFDAPLFYLGRSLPLSPGEQTRLHLFEPRYKLLIKEVMEGRSARDKSGKPLNARGVPRPRFIYVSGISSPIVPGDPALIVEVVKCKIHRDGRADVNLAFTRRGTITSIVGRPNSNRLIDAIIKTEPRRAKERYARDCVVCPLSTFHGPVFIMRTSSDPHMGVEIGLHLFEARYQLLVRETTEKLPATHKRGRPMPIPINDGINEIKQRPRFLWAFGVGGLSVGAPAVLVEIRRCRIMANGMADITIVPVKNARVTQYAERPESGGLHDAEAELSA